MATVLELYRYFNSSIPSDLSCDWDNDGLMCCPDAKREVKKILFTLDITESAAEYAVKEGFDLIISHHPLIFRPIRSLTESGHTGRILMELVRAGISAMSFHTRLDALSGGVNDALAEKLDILDPQPLGDKGEGRIGYIDGQMDIKAFAGFVKKRLGAASVKYIDGKRPVNKVAMVGGSGKDFISDALKAGVDTSVSGEIGYSAFTTYMGEGINIVEAGHFFTENPVLEKLVLMVRGYSAEIYTEKFFSNEIMISEV